ncbi:FAD/NAD(P)-binding oxidoreductase [Actinoplanes sp. NPDC049596]|uniref:FAD/NAD(P)-binding oxidoreductase n=1 Tax=unclassified Actinoplanes TaxID=2626549 RepID=UPI00342E9665
MRHEVIVIGGGTAGISVVSRLRRAGGGDIAIVKRSDRHFYQPLWSRVGGGRADADELLRPQAARMGRGNHTMPHATPPPSAPGGVHPPAKDAKLCGWSKRLAGTRSPMPARDTVAVATRP